MASKLSPAGRADLLAKYRELIALRRGARDGSIADPRARMRALAARFPGALRELDQRPIEELEARRDQLRGGGEPRWAVVSLAYHGWLRAGLRLKRLRRGQGHTTEAAPWEPTRERVEAQREAILSPPDGRLARWVLDRVCEDSGFELAGLTRMLFGVPGSGAGPPGEKA